MNESLEAVSAPFLKKSLPIDIKLYLNVSIYDNFAASMGEKGAFR